MDYKPLTSSSQVGDTVKHKGQYYKVYLNQNNKKTINLDNPLKLPDFILRAIKPEQYDLAGNKKESYDMQYPRVAQDRPGTYLDKQNRSQLVNLELKNSYNKYTNKAIQASLDIFQNAIGQDLMSDKELEEIFTPKGLIKRVSPLAALQKRLGPLTEETGMGIYNPRDPHVYKNITTLRKQIDKEGVDFFLKRTNLDVDVDINKAYELSEKFESGKITWEEFIMEKDKLNQSNRSEDNYLKTVVSRINNWYRKNSNLSVVRNTLKTYEAADNNFNYDYYLSMTDINSLNIQQVKNWKTQAKYKIIDEMYSNLKNDDAIKEEFAVPIFNNGKLQKYDMSRLKKALYSSFDANGDWDPNFIPETNYNFKFNRIMDSRKRPIDDVIRKQPGFKDSYSLQKIDYFLNDPREHPQNWLAQKENQDEWDKLGLKTYISDDFSRWLGRNIYGFPENKEFDLILKDAQAEGAIPYKTYATFSKWNMDAFNRSFTNVPIFPKTYSKILQRQFTKAIENIYTDKSDRNILNISTPFFEEVQSLGGTGIGVKALVKSINLGDKKGESHPTWESFVYDWKPGGGGLAPKINGVNRRISFMNAGESGYRDGDDEDQNKLGVKIINDFIEWTKNPDNDTKANSFTIEALKYANDSKDNSAMIIRFPKKFLNSIKEDGKDKNKYLNETDYDLLGQNGLSIIGLQGDFKNHLMNSTRTNLQAYVDYQGEYSYEHPSGLSRVEVTKDYTNGDYVITQYLYNIRTKKFNAVTTNAIRYGDNLDNAYLSTLQNADGYASSILNTYIFEENKKEEAPANEGDGFLPFGAKNN